MEVVDPSQHLGKHFTQPFQLWQWLNGGVVDTSQHVGKHFTQPLQLWQWLNGGVVDLYQHMHHVRMRKQFTIRMLDFEAVVEWWSG